jgi:hypothetical protein
MDNGDHESGEGPKPEHEDDILARVSRRISGAQNYEPRRLEQGEYFVSDTEDFWDRHLADLVNDTLGLGIARSGGLAPFGELIGNTFGTTRLLLAGYVQLGGHVNNLALSDWMPTSPRTSPKIHALVQLHARSLVLIEEIFVLTTTGYPSGASALARTLHEVRVLATFLHRFEAQLSERYLASHIVELWKNRADFAPSGAARRSRAWLATERELDERYREVIAKFGDSMTIENGWALPRFIKGRNKGSAVPRRIPFARLEEQVRRPFDRVIYRSGSQQVHASRLGSIKTLRAGEPNVALLGPRPYDLDRAANQAMWDVQDVTESLLRSCGKFTGNLDIYYWLEALDQLSYIVRGSVSDGQDLLDSVFAKSSAAE